MTLGRFRGTQQYDALLDAQKEFSEFMSDVTIPNESDKMARARRFQLMRERKARETREPKP